MIHKPDPVHSYRRTLRRVLFWLILITGVFVIWDAFLRANVFRVGDSSYIPVSINSIQTANYGLDTPGSVGQANLSLIHDVIQDLNPGVDANASFATLIASLNTRVPTVTPMASPTAAGIPTLGVPTVTLTLPSILPTIGQPTIVPTLIPPLQTVVPIPPPPIIPSNVPLPLPSPITIP
jgi:hypothetical protein